MEARQLISILTLNRAFQKIDDCIILLERQADLLKQIKSSLLLNMFPPSNAE